MIATHLYVSPLPLILSSRCSPRAADGAPEEDRRKGCEVAAHFGVVAVNLLDTWARVLHDLLSSPGCPQRPQSGMSFDEYLLASLKTLTRLVHPAEKEISDSFADYVSHIRQIFTEHDPTRPS
jgi:hypothetical protein